MLGSVGRYFYDRRRGIAKTVGFVGAAYLAGQYAIRRLEEMREKAMRDSAAKENLRRRFQQNQEDCIFHITALMPSLATNILEELDVEALTLQLQQARAPKSPQPSLQLPALAESTMSLLEAPSPATSLSVLSGSEGAVTPSVDGTAATLSSDLESISSASVAGDTENYSVVDASQTGLPIPGSTGPISSTSPSVTESWVDQFLTQERVERSAQGSPGSAAGHLSDSLASISVTTSDAEPPSSLADSLLGRTDEILPPPPLPAKSKAEIWKEIKILTFTRVMTILYVTSLLSLQTHIQLNLIGRHKYVESVRALEREEKLKEKQTGATSIGSLFWGESATLSAIEEADAIEEEGKGWGFDTTTEQKYLTMSWWLLNVGWKDVAERVREAVEAVLDSVSLKAMLSVDDIERVLIEIRGKIENGMSTGDSRPNSIGSVMFPASEADEGLVLMQGGLPSHLLLVDPPLRSLLNETKSLVRSADFGLVLGSCLDKALWVFMENVRTNVFDGEGEKMRLASLLPGFARWCHLALNGYPNELVEGLGQLRELAGFSAIIFASYEEN